MDKILKGKELIYQWRVLSMLDYIRSAIREKNLSKDELTLVIDSYIKFTKETVDARIIQLSADDYSNPQVQND